jgi:hypothetical protein
MRDPTAEKALANIERATRRKIRRKDSPQKLTHSEADALKDAKRLIEFLERL